MHMKQPVSLPVVAIVGRPNVGKSTLFNCILRERRSIVGDEPGITRDRIHGEASYRGRRFELIDTGGILPNDREWIASEIFRQARVALERADHIIFLVDGRSELTSSDFELARVLRRLSQPLSLVVNKIDSPARDNLVHEFHSLGIANLFQVSSEHRLGIDDLLDHVTEGFPSPRPPAMNRVREHDQDCHPRPPQRGQVHAAEQIGGRGSLHRLTGRGHHARCRGPDHRGGRRAVYLRGHSGHPTFGQYLLCRLRPMLKPLGPFQSRADRRAWANASGPGAHCRARKTSAASVCRSPA